MQWTAQSILEIAQRMEARPQGFRVSAKTAPMIIDAIRTYAREHCCEPIRDLAYTVDVWDKNGNAIVEHIAMVSNLLVAKAAFAAAVELRPGLVVIMRQGIRVVMSSHLGR